VVGDTVGDKKNSEGVKKEKNVDIQEKKEKRET